MDWTAGGEGEGSKPVEGGEGTSCPSGCEIIGQTHSRQPRRFKKL